MNSALLALTLTLGCRLFGDKSEETGPVDSAPDSAVEGPSPLVFTGERPKNLLLLTIDTMRRDRVNALGYERAETTPVLDGLIEDGVLFANHQSCSSWTWPSFLCMLSGRSLMDGGFRPASPPDPALNAPDDTDFLAELFKAEGFDTHLVSSNILLSEQTNMVQGYDTAAFLSGLTAVEVTDMSMQLLEEKVGSADPWLLHAHYIDPHAPYFPPAAFVEELELLPECPYELNTEPGTHALFGEYPTLSPEVRAACMAHLQVRYDGSIRFVDAQIGRLLESLEALELDEDTLIVVTTDHGEEFQDHGHFSHSHTLFEELVASFVIVSKPGDLPPARFDGLTAHEDLLPTLLSLFEIPATSPFTGGVMGVDTRTSTSQLTIQDKKATIQAVRGPQEKLIYSWKCEDTELGGPKFWFDLEADPTELDNLYDADDSAVIEAWAELLPEVETLAAEEGLSPCAPGP